jgi:bifunctional DNA-binding transcriptional regulator/antitoxin component of YhaV-PrlF toxin-antitoxin module
VRVMAAETVPVAGYTQLDEKGRLTLGKPLRLALDLKAGSTLAWLKMGEAIMLVPVDAYLAELMSDAAQAFTNAHLTLDHLDEELAIIRDEVTTEHYGSDFLAALGGMTDSASPR